MSFDARSFEKLSEINASLKLCAAAATLPIIERELDRLEARLEHLYVAAALRPERISAVEAKVKVLTERKLNCLEAITGVRG